MTRNKFKMILLSIMIITPLIFGSTAYAHEEEESDPGINLGITPDSPLYIFDGLMKKIGMFFAFSDEAKAKKALEYATERLSEANVMAAHRKLGEFKQATKDYNDFLAIAAEKGKYVEQQNGSENISEMIARATSKYLLPLYSPSHFVPQEAGEAVAEAKEVFSNEREHALRSLARKKLPTVVEINFETNEDGLDILQTKVFENNTEEATPTASEVAKSFELGEGIKEIAQGLGADGATIEQIVAKSSSIHLSTLVDVYEKFPERSKPVILRAMQASIKSHEKAVESLKEQGIVFNIPEKSAAIKMIRGKSEEGFISVQPRIYSRESLGDEAEGFLGKRINEESFEPREIEEKNINSFYAAEHELRRVRAEAAEAIHESELRLSNLRTEAKEAIFAAETELQEAINRIESERGELKSNDEPLEFRDYTEDAVHKAELRLQEVKAKYAKAIESAERELHGSRIRAERAIVEAERDLHVAK